jgi:hypothetical protein
VIGWDQAKHESGVVYSLAPGRGVGETEIAAAPKWLLDLLR